MGAVSNCETRLQDGFSGLFECPDAVIAWFQRGDLGVCRHALDSLNPCEALPHVNARPLRVLCLAAILLISGCASTESQLIEAINASDEAKVRSLAGKISESTVVRDQILLAVERGDVQMVDALLDATDRSDDDQFGWSCACHAACDIDSTNGGSGVATWSRS